MKIELYKILPPSEQEQSEAKMGEMRADGWRVAGLTAVHAGLILVVWEREENETSVKNGRKQTTKES